MDESPYDIEKDQTSEYSSNAASSSALSAESASAAPSPPPVVSPMGIQCPNCNYNLTGATIGSPCPECGLIVGRAALSIGAPTSGKSIASLVLGIVSIVTCSAYGVLAVPCGVIAIALANAARKDIRHGRCSSASNGLASAGRVCGIIGLSLGLLFILIIIFAIIASSSSW